MGENVDAKPKWLDWTRRLQSVAQNGIAYTKDPFDLERFQAVNKIASEMAAAYTGLAPSFIEGLFLREGGYATPKLDVRAAVFDRDEILFVRELADGLWTLPGGWIDAGESPREAVVREVFEETGYKVRPARLLAVFDKNKHDHPPAPFHAYKIMIECDVLEKAPLKSIDTTEAKFFPLSRLPPLSPPRITRSQIERIFELHRRENSPSHFD